MTFASIFFGTERILPTQKDAARNLGRFTTGRGGLRLDTPFRLADYTATINPRVTLNSDGTAMVVTGTCSARILGHRGPTPVYITFARTSFAYNIVTTPSRTSSVGVEGWNSTSSVHVTTR